jgi:hypothetical protein
VFAPDESVTVVRHPEPASFAGGGSAVRKANLGDPAVVLVPGRLRKTQKNVIPNPVLFLNGVRNLLFPGFSSDAFANRNAAEHPHIFVDLLLHTSAQICTDVARELH